MSAVLRVALKAKPKWRLLTCDDVYPEATKLLPRGSFKSELTISIKFRVFDLCGKKSARFSCLLKAMTELGQHLTLDPSDSMHQTNFPCLVVSLLSFDKTLFTALSAKIAHQF